MKINNSPSRGAGTVLSRHCQKKQIYNFRRQDLRDLLRVPSNPSITLLSFDLQRNYYFKNVVLFEENSILLLPECLEASGVKSVWGEVSQESPKNR